MSKLFRSIAVPAVATGETTARRRRNAYSPYVSVDDRYSCAAIVPSSGWKCGRPPTCGAEIDGRRRSLCTQHGTAWLAGKALIVATEIIEDE